MKTYITKEVVFDSAHFLPKHKGKCSNIHGHTYKVQVRVGADITKKADGMVVDFSELKDLINEEIIDLYDHKLIIDSTSSKGEKLINFCAENNFSYVSFTGQPTAERMAENIYRRIDDKIKRGFFLSVGVELCSVSVWETPTSFATFGTT